LLKAPKEASIVEIVYVAQFFLIFLDEEDNQNLMEFLIKGNLFTVLK